VSKNKKPNGDPPNGTQRQSVVTPKTLMYGMSGCFSVIKTFIWVAGAVAIAAILWLCVREVAGKETTFRAGLEGVLRASVDRYIAWVVIAILAYFNRRQKKLTESIIRDRAPYISELERKVDPKRSSSRLDEKGNPRQEDKDA
jgi:hypothetical protein